MAEQFQASTRAWVGSWTDRRADIIAGFTTAVLLIPQSMAYAALAGLPPITGLYAALVPLIAYAVLGSSRHLTVGPVAVVSLMTAHVLAPHAHAGPEKLVVLAAALAAMVGGFQVLMAILRMGFITRWITPPILLGFVSAMALLTISTQLGSLLGLDLAGAARLHHVAAQVSAKISGIHVWTMAVSVCALGLLLFFQRHRPAFPAALVAVALGSLFVWLMGGDEFGVATVGELPAGLPSLAIPWLTTSELTSLTFGALAIALVGFIQSITAATIFATRHRYKLAPTRELLGVGAANIVASLFQALPVAGSFSRSAVNDAAGARSRWSAVVTVLCVALTLLFLTSLFYHLPNAVLAATIVIAVARLIKVSSWLHYARTNRHALLIASTTFTITLFFGVEAGIATGVATTALAASVSRLRGGLRREAQKASM